jgi:hypothetical protein
MPTGIYRWIILIARTIVHWIQETEDWECKASDMDTTNTNCAFLPIFCISFTALYMCEINMHKNYGMLLSIKLV